MASINVDPVYQAAEGSLAFSTKFRPANPEHGTYEISPPLNPAWCKKLHSFSQISLNLDCDHETLSILFTATINWLTPKLQRFLCSMFSSRLVEEGCESMAPIELWP